MSDNAIKFSPSAGIGMPGEIDVYAVKVNEMRFVILSQPRTGSSLLVSSLRAHPQVCCRDEVINSHQADWFKDLPWPGADRLMTCLAGQDGQAIGCKMHACDPDPDHRSPSEWESAWDALSEDQEVRVICLYRQNVIAQLASWKVAEALHEWGVQSSGPRPKIQISPNELRWFHKWNRFAYQSRLGRLTQHSVKLISYEELIDNWDTLLADIQEFLGVEKATVKQSIPKSETRNLDEVVLNYSELTKLPWAAVRFQ